MNELSHRDRRDWALYCLGAATGLRLMGHNAMSQDWARGAEISVGTRKLQQLISHTQGIEQRLRRDY